MRPPQPPPPCRAPPPPITHTPAHTPEQLPPPAERKVPLPRRLDGRHAPHDGAHVAGRVAADQLGQLGDGSTFCVLTHKRNADHRETLQRSSRSVETFVSRSSRVNPRREARMKAARCWTFSSPDSSSAARDCASGRRARKRT